MTIAIGWGVPINESAESGFWGNARIAAMSRNFRLRPNAEVPMRLRTARGPI
jgi:hypothetical protein